MVFFFVHDIIKEKEALTMLEAYKRILVALDGSSQSEKAFKEAIEIAKRNNATVFFSSDY